MTGAGTVQYILFTDIGRSSYLWEQFPAEYPAALETHNRITEAVVEAAGGEVMKNMGDGYIALFPAADSAVAAAVELQLQLGASAASAPIPPFPDGSELQLRVTVHCGELQRLGTGRGWFGTPLNRAARICGVCHPGQLLLSASVRRALAAAPPGCTLDDLGPCRLRDMGEPEQLFQLSRPDFAKRQFPPLVTLDSRPNNLAVQPNAFIGREDELRELARLLTQHRLLTLHAPGGYGKSRLANQLCANVLGRFEQGVFEVLLAPLKEHSRLPEAVANATGFQFSGSRPPEQQILDYLRAKEILLYFDNFEHVLDGADFISEILKAAPKVRILTTSREPLRLSAERVYRLEPLPTGAGSDSVQLFADRAALVAHGFTLDEQSAAWAERICTRLEGVPLSIELFAAWVDDFTLEEMHNQLDQQLEMTARMRDIPARQRSVRASCDWSWNLLTEEQHDTLMRLAPFRGGISAAGAGAVLGLSGPLLQERLRALVHKSWLYRRDAGEEARWHLRDAAVHAYALMKLEETGAADAAAVDSSLNAQARAAHARYFAGLVGREGPRLSGPGFPDEGQAQLAALHTWKLELENINEALDTALRFEAADWLMLNAQHLGRYLNQTGDYHLATQRCARLLEAASQLCKPEIEVHALLGLARAQVRLGKYHESLESARAARELALTQHNRNWEAVALHGIAMAEDYMSSFDSAQELYLQSLAIAEGLGDRSTQSDALNTLGGIADNHGNYHAAREYYARAVALRQEFGDRIGEAMVQSNLGIIEAKQGNYQIARELWIQALPIFEGAGLRYGASACLTNLAAAELSTGNYSVSIDLCRQALTITRDLGNRTAEALALNALGSAQRAAGNYSAAAESCGEALAIRREIGDRWGEAESLEELASVEEQRGNYEIAYDLALQGLELKRSIHNQPGIMRAHYVLGIIETVLGRHDSARSHLREALSLSRELGEKPFTIRISLRAAQTLAAQRDWRSAAVCSQAAHSAANTHGDQFAAEEQELLQPTAARLDEAVSSSEISADELALWQTQGQAMSLDELAEFTLKTLAG